MKEDEGASTMDGDVLKQCIKETWRMGGEKEFTHRNKYELNLILNNSFCY